MISAILGLQDLGRARSKLIGSAGKGDRLAVSKLEETVRATAGGAIEFDTAGFATLRLGGCAYAGGRFETVSIQELWRRVRTRTQPQSGAGPRLSVLTGTDPVTDIGALQATAEPGTLFQVASQFNCLEAPGPNLTKVASYFGDPTQGPRASVSAFPATLVRHYAAPRANDERFTQTSTDQIDLLSDVCSPKVARVVQGYLTSYDIGDAHAFSAALEDNFEKIRVGVHEGVEVVLGYNWDGAVEPVPKRIISQVFTSTFAGGGYSSGDLDGMRDPICGALLRAAYVGTLLAAASLGASRVVLTLIGGGVFGNSHNLIWESILWATNELRVSGIGPIDVVVNAREGMGASRAGVVAAIDETGGTLLELNDGHARVSVSLTQPNPPPASPTLPSNPNPAQAPAKTRPAPVPQPAPPTLEMLVGAAGGKVSMDDAGLGRIIVKLPPTAGRLSKQIQLATGCEVRLGGKYLVHIIPPTDAKKLESIADPPVTPKSGSREPDGGDVWVAVADLHGQRAHLAALLDYLDGELGTHYRLCTLGDYVDNGQDIPGLLDDLIALQASRGDRFVPIIGNHDLALLRTLGWPGEAPNEAWYASWSGRYWNGGLGTPQVYAQHQKAGLPRSAKAFAALFPASHRAFLAGLPWYHDAGDYLFVHAGMKMGPLEPQLRDLAALTLPAGHTHLPDQIREKDLSKNADSTWNRVVVSAHNKHIGARHFEGPNRICLSGEVDSTGTLYAVVLAPQRRWLSVKNDLIVREG